jgi:lactate 2-monooxygenase
MYAGGSAGTNSTFRANLRAFDKYGIIPRMLVNASQRSLEVCHLQDFGLFTDIE